MSDQVVHLRDLLAPSVVSLVASFQMGRFAWAVGQARRKFKVPVPQTDGDEGFVRVFRAQQNTLEFAPLFLPCVWISSLFVHPVPSTIVSLRYLYARSQYFESYSKKAEDRVPHFITAVKCFQILLVMSAAGLINLSLKEFAGVDVFGKVVDFFRQYIPQLK
ncbi:microsomal glutathione S-transferase 2-like [Apostichopus japonicus]|uniref:microsomal glutathione S-transferase 2-like n=1 Tax=Stichopus japonicus TaxID=307972 RepID=UPI003AB44CA1